MLGKAGCATYPPVVADLEFAVVMHSTLFQSSLLRPHAGCHHLSDLLSNQFLQKLRDKANTVLVVEHDPDVIKVADHVVEAGPHRYSRRRDRV
jgi:hypothetical protein